MPITDEGTIEYSIPEEYKAMITKSFLQTLRYGLQKHLGKGTYGSNLGYNDEETWVYASGSYGWQMAFTEAAKLHKLDELLSYYDSLDWYDSDRFDGDIIDLAVFYNVITPMPPVTRWEILWSRINWTWQLREYYFLRFTGWIKSLFKKKKKPVNGLGWALDKQLEDLLGESKLKK